MIISALGRVWMFWPGRLEAKKRCKVLNKTGWYKCEKCKQEREKIDIDHIHPIVKPEDGFIDWNTYISSKFVEADKLQGLCRECHKAKSKEENQVRRLCKKLKNV